MRRRSDPNRSESSLRAVVSFVIIVMVAAAWIIFRPGPAQVTTAPTEPTQQRLPVAVAMSFLVVSIPAPAAERPDVTALLESIGRAPGGQAGATLFGQWRSQLATLTGAGVATTEAAPAVLVNSGEASTIKVGSQGATSTREISIRVVPVAGDAGPITLSLAVRSEQADSELELWAGELGVPLGASGSVERETVVLPGGGAGVVVSIRSPLRQEGWMVVLVGPKADPTPPAGSPNASGE